MVAQDGHGIHSLSSLSGQGLSDPEPAPSSSLGWPWGPRPMASGLCAKVRNQEVGGRGLRQASEPALPAGGPEPNRDVRPGLSPCLCRAVAGGDQGSVSANGAASEFSSPQFSSPCPSSNPGPRDSTHIAPAPSAPGLSAAAALPLQAWVPSPVHPPLTGPWVPVGPDWALVSQELPWHVPGPASI